MQKNNIQTCDCNVLHLDSVKLAQKNMLDNNILEKMVIFYKAFSDNTRLKIINALDNCELCVCDICVLLNMTKSAVSHQLKFLKDCQLIKGRKQGKEVLYSLSDEHVKQIFEVCKEHIMELEYEKKC